MREKTEKKAMTVYLGELRAQVRRLDALVSVCRKSQPATESLTLTVTFRWAARSRHPELPASGTDVYEIDQLLNHISDKQKQLPP